MLYSLWVKAVQKYVFGLPFVEVFPPLYSSCVFYDWDPLVRVWSRSTKRSSREAVLGCRLSIGRSQCRWAESRCYHWRSLLWRSLRLSPWWEHWGKKEKQINLVSENEKLRRAFQIISSVKKRIGSSVMLIPGTGTSITHCNIPCIEITGSYHEMYWHIFYYFEVDMVYIRSIFILVWRVKY